MHALTLLTTALSMDNEKISPHHLLKSFLLGQVRSTGLTFREISDNSPLSRCPMLMGGLQASNVFSPLVNHKASSRSKVVLC